MMVDIAIDVGPAIIDLDARLLLTHANLKSVSQVLEDELVVRARAKASGDVVEIRSGDYLRSIVGGIKIGDDGVTGYVSSDAPGAGFLESGGDIPAHDILPDVAMALRFMGSVGDIYAAVIHDPGAHVAPHSVIHAALIDMQDEIETKLEDAVTSVWGA